jgi:hypothetical protein
MLMMRMVLTTAITMTVKAIVIEMTLGQPSQDQGHHQINNHHADPTNITDDRSRVVDEVTDIDIEGGREGGGLGLGSQFPNTSSASAASATVFDAVNDGAVVLALVVVAAAGGGAGASPAHSLAGERAQLARWEISLPRRHRDACQVIQNTNYDNDNNNNSKNNKGKSNKIRYIYKII